MGEKQNRLESFLRTLQTIKLLEIVALCTQSFVENRRATVVACGLDFNELKLRRNRIQISVYILCTFYGFEKTHCKMSGIMHG